MKTTNRQGKPLTRFLSFAFSLLIVVSAARADDVDVYRTQASDSVVKPNVLFVLDESSSMTLKDGDSTTRSEEVRIALRNIFKSPKDGGVENINAAFMGFSKRKYGGRRVITSGTPTGFYDVDSSRSDLVDKIEKYYAISGTTTVQAMRSAVQWFKSGFTDDDGSGSYDGCYKNVNECPKGTGRGSDVTVTTPVNKDLYCASNVVVLLTDGAPHSDQVYSDRRYNDPHPYKSAGYRYDPNDVTVPLSSGVHCTDPDPSGSLPNGGCTGDIAEWAYQNDLFPNIEGTQNITTHTIGFHTEAAPTARPYLEDIAARGGGNYYESSNADALKQAFDEIIVGSKASISFSFNAPAIPFDPSSAAASGKDLYLPLLVPDVTKFWKGNLKKYHIEFNTNTEVMEITDRNGAPVVDDQLVFQDVQDYWNTGSSDQGDPLLGGAASMMTGNRRLYTYLGKETDLTDIQNRVRKKNKLITKAMLGLGASENMKRRHLLDWVNWREDDGKTPRQGVMGAPLHTKPVVVGKTVYINTTEGLLHAFNTKTGKERWAFMPDELLSTIKQTRATLDDPDHNKSKTPSYGLDGPMTYYKSNGHEYLVFGMRRGGRNYYALDITNPIKPAFAWEIKGGSTTGYANLGQTWSKPIFARVELEGNAARDVLIFGGGYDPAVEDTDPVETTRPTHSNVLGNSIFIVDPTDGKLIREIDSVVQGSLGDSIAADVLPVDINANGITDRLYVADVGGRIIRIDMPDKAIAKITGSNSVSATVLADVGASNGYQRFFNTPEVAYNDRGGVSYLAILISSGYRPNPLDDSVTDRFFMIKDFNIWTPPADSDGDGFPDYDSPITDDQSSPAPDLYDATANLIQQGNGSTAVDANGNATDKGSKLYAKQHLDASKGWYIDFSSGEKGLSPAKVWAYSVIFNTYKAERQSGSSACEAAVTVGESRAYVVNMNDGSAIFSTSTGTFEQTNDTSTLDRDDRSTSLIIPGMPPAPSLIFPDNSDNVYASGGDLKFPLKWKDRFHAISWEEVTDD